MTTIPDIYTNVPKDTLLLWQQYQKDNPDIWAAFRIFAKQMKASGRKRYGAKGIMERVRWHFAIKQKGEFKINNDFTALYARKMVNNYPEFKGFFELRTIKGLKRAEADKKGLPLVQTLKDII